MVTGAVQFNRPGQIDEVGPDGMHAVFAGGVHIFQRVITHVDGLVGLNPGGFQRGMEHVRGGFALADGFRRVMEREQFGDADLAQVGVAVGQCAQV